MIINAGVLWRKCFIHREVVMGTIVPFKQREKTKTTFESDFTAMLKDVAEVKREALGAEVNGIFILNAGFENMIKAMVGSFIIDHRLMNADLFRCGLYVSHVLAEMLSKTVESYYVIDYLTRGIEEEDPLLLRQGADLCCLLCILFEGRQNWRMVKAGDYMKLGIQLYALYHAKTKRMIGWSMSKNFEAITSITKQCIEGMARR